jgi:hypothetical protein
MDSDKGNVNLISMENDQSGMDFPVYNKIFNNQQPSQSQA